MPASDDDADRTEPAPSPPYIEGGAADGALFAGAVVQRVDAGDRAIVVKVRRPGETAYVVAVAGRGAGITKAKPARPAGSKSVARLEGFRIAWIARGEIALVRAEAERARIAIEPSRIVVRTRVEEADAPEEIAREEEREAWETRGAEIADIAGAGAIAAMRADAIRAVKRATTRLSRRADAVKGDLAKMDQARAIASQLPWLVAEASRAPRGARSLKVVDWSTGEAREIEVPLDPGKPARAQVEAMFARARRLKHGTEVASARLAETESTLAKLAPIAIALDTADDAPSIESLLARARSVAPKDVKLDVVVPGGARTKQAKSLPYRTFTARDGRTRLLVGRGAAHNDALTFQIARPRDLWLHAKSLPGAHVIVPLDKDRTCPPDVLVDAAHLAAHFSDARDEAVVDVQYAQRRHLRKPRGSAPGLVVVDREKVIAVRIDRDALRALLESEEAG